tara:strand:+ start:73451 stop:74218 length:768 start_codon:yes stop_codon:yes gene_type:complete
MNKNKRHTPQSIPSPSGRAREGLFLKVCGMKYQDNIQHVAALQPHYLGFIFYEKSVRYFEADNIPELAKGIKKTGVFVDADLDFVIKKIKTHQLQAVQLHGHESPEYCETLKTLCHSALDAESTKNKTDMKEVPAFAGMTEIIKVFSIRNAFDFDVLKPYEDVCDYFLFDTKGKLPGGNGYTFDWNVLNNYPSTKPFFLSGGIGINQIEDLKKFQQSKASKYCYAIDVNSKFEVKPGLKNIELLKEFKEDLSFHA